MIHAYITPITNHYFIKQRGSQAAVLLYLPEPEFLPLGEGYARLSPHYPAFYQLYQQAKKVEAALAPFSPTRYNGSLKNLFVESGCAVRLKNDLVAIPPFGSRVSLFAFLVEGEHQEKLPTFDAASAQCPKGCNRCVKACPTGALTDGFCFQKCLRGKMDAYDKTPPSEFLPLAGGIFGCDWCQTVCPKNAGLLASEMPKAWQELLELTTLHTLCKNRETLAPLAAVVGNNYNKPRRVLFFCLNAASRPSDLAWVKPYQNHEDAVISGMANEVVARLNRFSL